MIENRVDIKNFILQIEHNFPVNDWKINNVNLWPILRIRLFFYLVSIIESKSDDNKKTNKKLSAKLTSLKSKIKKPIKNSILVFNYFAFIFKLPKKEYLFVGADSHRVNYKNSRYNRYFDVLIENQNLENKSIYFEYGTSTSSGNQFNKNLIYKFSKALKGYIFLKQRAENVNINLNGYENFLDYLSNQELSFQTYLNRHSKEELINWVKNNFLLKIDFFTKVLKRVKPKQVAILCYYSDNIMALCAAANKLNIETIEMQHGPQTDIHLSYSNWSVLPKEGYDVLPRTYWSWDEYGKNVIKKWTKNNQLYKVQVIGNPWIEYWKNKKEEYQFKDYILYSLQPSPLTLDQLFTPSILSLMKSTTTKWFIRLHPRQMNELDNIKDILKKNGVLQFVNIHEATNDPLPQLIYNAKLHVTHFSGSALEASSMNVKTILINEISLKSFHYLIEDNHAYFIDYRDEEFLFKFNEILKDE